MQQSCKYAKRFLVGVDWSSPKTCLIRLHLYTELYIPHIMHISLRFTNRLLLTPTGRILYRTVPSRALVQTNSKMKNVTYPPLFSLSLFPFKFYESAITNACTSRIRRPRAIARYTQPQGCIRQDFIFFLLCFSLENPRPPIIYGRDCSCACFSYWLAACSRNRRCAWLTLRTRKREKRQEVLLG